MNKTLDNAPITNFKELLNNLFYPIFLTGNDNIILEANKAACELFGYKQEELYHLNIEVLVNTTDEKWNAMLTERIAKKAMTVELTGIKKNGVRFPCEFSSVIFKSDNGREYVTLSIHDISQRKKYEKDLQFQSSLLSSIQQAVIVTDPNGIITYWNQYAERLYGWKSEEVLGQPILDITPTEMSKDQAGIIMDELISGKSWDGEFRVKNKEGETFTAFVHNSPMQDEKGRLTGIIGISWDTTPEMKIKEQIKFQANLLDSVEQAVIASDLYGKIYYWNRYAEKLYGWTKEEAIGQNAAILKSGEPFFEELGEKLMAQFREGKGWSGEFNVKNKKGKIFPVFTVNSPVFASDGTLTGIIAVSYDISERKRKEEITNKSELRFKTIFEQSPLGIALIDSYNGKIYDANPQFAAITGRTVAELKKTDWMSITHPEDVIKDLNNMERLNSGEIRGFTMEKRYLRPEGTVVWIQMSIAPIATHEDTGPQHLCMIEDITKRKEAEEIVQVNIERFNLVAKATNDAIWDWNLVTSQVLRTGNGLEILFGYNSAEADANDMFWKNRVHPDDLSAVLQKRDTILREKLINFWEDEYRFLKANGEYAYVYDKGYVIRNDQGEPIRMIGATQDITMRKETERQLKILNESLEKRAHELQLSNAELERFAYVASHDLQEPLRMVSSFLQLLEKKYRHQLDETADQYIHFAVDGANRMKKLILDLLEYSRVGTNNALKSDTDMNEVVVEVIKTFQEQIQALKAVIRVTPLPVLPNTRRVQMIQLLQNLIGNALKYHGTSVPEISIGVMENENEWIFHVKDNGIGFKEQFTDKIFILFQRLHSHTDYPGTGIGLSICKKIMDRHGGRIWAESELGKGSTFYFSFKKNN